jgi:hypothetical protein
MSDRRLGRKRKKKKTKNGGWRRKKQKKKKCKKKTAFDRVLLESKPRDKFESLEMHLFFFSEYSIERCEYSVSQLVDDTEEDDEKEEEEEEVQSSSLKTSHRETTRTSSHHYSVSGSGFGSFLRRRRGLTRDAASTSFPRASSSERFKKWTGRTIARRRRDGRRRRRRIEKPLL